MNRKAVIVHVINSLEFGGAEAMLVNLILRCDRTRFNPSVVCLIDEMTMAGRLLEAGISISTISMKSGLPDPRGLFRLTRLLRRLRPDIVQTWMDHSNLIGGIATRLGTRARVVWGIHHSYHPPALTKRSTLATVAACARVSRIVPHQIIYCSEHSQRLYGEAGFAGKHMTVIPNGFDTDVFRPDPAARLSVREELGLAPDATLIGLIARYDPTKGHATFLEAAARLHAIRPDVHFLLAGGRVDASNAVLAGQIHGLRLGHRCHLIGGRSDVARIHASLDLATSSSITEAFPLVVGEAMACGVPTVVTDVGDSALIVGSTGRVIRPGDPGGLADAWNALLSLAPPERTALGLAARERIQSMFELDVITARYEATYRDLLSIGATAPAADAGPVQSRTVQATTPGLGA